MPCDCVTAQIPADPARRDPCPRDGAGGCPPGAAASVLAAVLALIAVAAAAVEPQGPVLGVIGFDLCEIDADGLVGPPGGKVALDYELCIPAAERFVAEVQAIDDSARFQPHSPGRIGCGPDQVLVLGNTQGPDFAFVLQRLADLPYVERIERAWHE
jgi:hypothetical protein